MLRHKPIEGSYQLLCSFPTANASNPDSLAFISLGSLLERNNIFNAGVVKYLHSAVQKSEQKSFIQTGESEILVRSFTEFFAHLTFIQQIIYSAEQLSACVV